MESNFPTCLKQDFNVLTCSQSRQEASERNSTHFRRRSVMLLVWHICNYCWRMYNSQIQILLLDTGYLDINCNVALEYLVTLMHWLEIVKSRLDHTISSKQLHFSQFCCGLAFFRKKIPHMIHAMCSMRVLAFMWSHTWIDGHSLYSWTPL